MYSGLSVIDNIPLEKPFSITRRKNLQFCRCAERFLYIGVLNSFTNRCDEQFYV